MGVGSSLMGELKIKKGRSRSVVWRKWKHARDDKKFLCRLVFVQRVFVR